MMVGESHESERWSSYSPRTVFVFAALSQCVCCANAQYVEKLLVFALANNTAIPHIIVVPLTFKIFLVNYGNLPYFEIRKKKYIYYNI